MTKATACPITGLTQEEQDARLYAEGVEAGLRWAAGYADEPFPR